MKQNPGTRLTRVLDGAGIPRSSWYRDAASDGDPAPRGRPGPRPKPVPVEMASAVIEMATSNPWYGYRKIAVMCRRAGTKANNRQCYRVMKEHNLLKRPAKRLAEAYQAAKLYELLPTRPDALWQMDVTYVHIPGSGWWYGITVIDYYSRYLLALRLSPSYAATEVLLALRDARREAERIHGPLATKPFLVTDNGPSFIAKVFAKGIADGWTHVRIQYRTPQQLGLLERFHRTLKDEEVYWRLYDGPAHARECFAEFRSRYNARRPHWALVPEEGGDPVTPEDVYVHGVSITIPKWQGWAREAKRKLEEMLGDGARILQKAE